LGYVNSAISDAACERLLPEPTGGHIATVGPFRQYTAADRENLDDYEHKRQEAIAKLKERGLVLGRLHPNETHLVANKSAYVVPYQADMLRWLTKILPSVCIRDAEGHPIAWIASYSSGAFGASYVSPDHRGQKLADAMTLEMICNMGKLTSSSRFFWISDSNKASIRQVERMYVDLKSTETLGKCVVFTPSKMGTSGKPTSTLVPGSGWTKDHPVLPQVKHHEFKRPNKTAPISLSRGWNFARAWRSVAHRALRFLPR
jgi:hypothetical protein